MYEQIHYENENGERRIVSCESEADYQREIEAGSRWIEAEPRRFRDMHAERFINYSDGSVDLAHLAMQRRPV